MAPSTAEFEFDRWEFKSTLCTDRNGTSFEMALIKSKNHLMQENWNDMC